jgi:hypothetical protein
MTAPADTAVSFASGSSTAGQGTLALLLFGHSTGPFAVKIMGEERREGGREAGKRMDIV